MQAGDTIGRRFLLVRADDEDLPGLARYLARDTRLGEDVTVDIITSGAPSAVIRAAQRARVLRDKRLARVLAAGIERRGNERIFYAVTERPRGVRLDELLGKVAFEPASAAAVIGEAATALSAAAGSGLHHGLVRATAITVTDRGRVILSGLGIDGVIAAQAKRVKVTNERTDAVALANLYLAAITAMDPTEVTVEDLPGDLSPEARGLCETLLRGAGPQSLADVTAALGTGDSHILRALVKEAPSLWWPRSPVALITAGIVTAGIVTAGIDAGGEAATSEGFAADGDGDFAGGLAGTLAGGTGGLDVDVDDADVMAANVIEGELVNGELVTTGGDIDVIEGDLVDLAAARPRTRFGRAVDDLDEFHDIVAAQNIGSQQSVAEALLERLHQRFPASAPLADAAAVARRRAHAPAPLNVGPLLLALLVVGIFVATIVAASMLTKPYVPAFDGHNNPPQTYPKFTLGTTSLPD